MGYETEVFLVDGIQLFGKWEPRSAYWYTKNMPKGDNADIDALPEDAQFCDGGCIVASLKLSKIGSDGEEGDLPGLFARNRKRQKAEKKYMTLQWHPTDNGDDEKPIITDPYGDPYTAHDAKETLAALRETIRQEEAEWKDLQSTMSRHRYANRRLAMFEAMLSIFVDEFPNCGVITRGY
jgi:hypothetical protein